MYVQFHIIPLDMVSRLKGIETNNSQLPIVPYYHFGYGFPFEGNWNFCRYRIAAFFWFLTLDMVSRLKGIETILHSLESSAESNDFGYGFPFEGNWNTYWQTRICRSARYFGYGFPFEGNWNLVNFFWGWRVTLRKLWIWFPVWRELKLPTAANACFR